MMKTRHALAALLLCACACATAQSRPEIVLVPKQVTAHGWFFEGETGMAIFLAVWGLVVVGGSENIVRPLLMGKGIQAPIAVVFLGVIGGVVAFGFLGLFIGPTMLTVGYNLFQEWMATIRSADPVPTAAPGRPDARL